MTTAEKVRSALNYIPNYSVTHNAIYRALHWWWSNYYDGELYGYEYAKWWESKRKDFNEREFDEKWYKYHISDDYDQYTLEDIYEFADMYICLGFGRCYYD